MTSSRQQGFTLIELMVMLLIIGIASAAISLSIRPAPLQSLRKDAERLAQLLRLAQVEARLDGRPISWRPDAIGFAFSRSSDDGRSLDHFKDDPQLRPRRWESSPIKVRIEPGPRLVLNAEWIDTPLHVQLSDGQNSMTVQLTATGGIRVMARP